MSENLKPLWNPSEGGSDRAYQASFQAKVVKQPKKYKTLHFFEQKYEIKHFMRALSFTDIKTCP